VAFAAGMLGGLPRSDQRVTGELYLRGLMLDGKRKSMQPMAARLGVDHQRLQQFVTSSTWDHVEVRRRVARWAAEFIRPDAYVIDDSGFPKDGADSPGVARMYSGTLGKVGNCQIDVSVHAVTDRASAAIDWRLFLPKSWDDTTTTDAADVTEIQRRRARCKIPDAVRHREKWRLALDMLDEILGGEAGEGGWSLPARPVVADAGYGGSHRVPPGPGRPGPALCGRGQGHHQRLSSRRRAQRPAVHRPRPATDAALSGGGGQPHRPGPRHRPPDPAPGHLAPRFSKERS
jgi:SRSO17 transposase